MSRGQFTSADPLLRTGGQTTIILISGTFHYLSDGLEMCAPPYYKLKYMYTFPFLQSSLRVKISQAVRSYKGCLEIPMVVDLTTELASVRASTVDHSHSTMC